MESNQRQQTGDDDHAPLGQRGNAGCTAVIGHARSTRIGNDAGCCIGIVAVGVIGDAQCDDPARDDGTRESIPVRRWVTRSPAILPIDRPCWQCTWISNGDDSRGACGAGGIDTSHDNRPVGRQQPMLGQIMGPYWAVCLGASRRFHEIGGAAAHQSAVCVGAANSHRRGHMRDLS